MSDFWSEELISDYLDDRLDAAARQQVETYLKGNLEASNQLSDFVQMRAALQSVQQHTLGSGFSDRVLMSIPEVNPKIQGTEIESLSRQDDGHIGSQPNPNRQLSGKLNWKTVSIGAVAATILIALFVFPPGSVQDETALNRDSTSKSVSDQEIPQPDEAYENDQDQNEFRLGSVDELPSRSNDKKPAPSEFPDDDIALGTREESFAPAEPPLPRLKSRPKVKGSSKEQRVDEEDDRPNLPGNRLAKRQPNRLDDPTFSGANPKPEVVLPEVVLLKALNSSENDELLLILEKNLHFEAAAGESEIPETQLVPNSNVLPDLHGSGLPSQQLGQNTSELSTSGQFSVDAPYTLPERAQVFEIVATSDELKSILDRFKGAEEKKKLNGTSSELVLGEVNRTRLGRGADSPDDFAANGGRESIGGGGGLGGGGRSMDDSANRGLGMEDAETGDTSDTGGIVGRPSFTRKIWPRSNGFEPMERSDQQADVGRGFKRQRAAADRPPQRPEDSNKVDQAKIRKRYILVVELVAGPNQTNNPSKKSSENDN